MAPEAIDPILRFAEKVHSFFVLFSGTAASARSHVKLVGIRPCVEDRRIIPSVKVSVSFNVEMPREQFAAISHCRCDNVA